MVKQGYQQSKVDPCLYYHKNVLQAIYIDDCILLAKEEKDLWKAIKLLAIEFKMTDEVEVDKHLGVKIEKREDSTIKMYQPYLITQIMENLGTNNKTKVKNTRAVTSKILHRDISGKEMRTQWEYARIIGQQKKLGNSTRPDIAFAVQQCTRFMSNPSELHKQAMLRIGRYLKATREEAIFFKPEKEQNM